PRALYSTQSFTSWVQYFLSRADVEDMLEEPFRPRRQDGRHRDIYDAPVWRNLKDANGRLFTYKKENLVFSFFSDWYNPFTMRIAGKQRSTGIFIFFCLNLLINARYRPENLFVAGLTPGGKEPTVTMINNILEPIVQDLEILQEGRVF
ncbi:hypothetical protein BT69DRAFT_1198683, partial [Atractiella rhizophila]